MKWMDQGRNSLGVGGGNLRGYIQRSLRQTMVGEQLLEEWKICRIQKGGCCSIAGQV